MVKKIIITTLAIILLGAVSVGAYDAYQGNSSLSWPNGQFLQTNQTNQFQGQEQGYGQGSRGQAQGQGWRQDQAQYGPTGPGQGNGSGIPQMEHEWVTVSGIVVAADQQSLVVDTAEMGELTLWFGAPGFAEQQGVIFNPGDTVTILGFEGTNGVFQAGQITNETTQASLHLRDPNGRPLWAGRGQGNGSGRGQ